MGDNDDRMGLTPEERQRIYEEEKARLEARTQIKGAKQRNGCLGCLGALGGLIVLGLIGSLLSSSSRDSVKQEGPATSTPQAVRGPELVKNIGLVNDALGEMKVDVAGQSLDHMSLTLEVFNAAAKLIAAAEAESLTSADLSRVSALRRALVRRQLPASSDVNTVALVNPLVWPDHVSTVECLALGRAEGIDD